MEAEQPRRPWVSRFFGQKPMSDGQYAVLLLLFVALVLLIAVGTAIGMDWSYLVLQSFVAVGFGITVVRERQRRMRERAARLSR